MPNSLSNRTFQGFNLHPTVAQRLDQIYKELEHANQKYEKLSRDAITPEQVRTTAQQAAQQAYIAATNQPQNLTYAPIVELFIDGLVSTKGGCFVIRKSAVYNGSLGPPTVPNGQLLVISSATPFAHKITTVGYGIPGLMINGSGAVQGANFPAHAGAGLTMMAYNNAWLVLANQFISFF